MSVSTPSAGIYTSSGGASLLRQGLLSCAAVLDSLCHPFFLLASFFSVLGRDVDMGVVQLFEVHGCVCANRDIEAMRCWDVDVFSFSTQACLYDLMLQDGLKN